MDTRKLVKSIGLVGAIMGVGYCASEHKENKRQGGLKGSADQLAGLSSDPTIQDLLRKHKQFIVVTLPGFGLTMSESITGLVGISWPMVTTSTGAEVFVAPDGVDANSAALSIGGFVTSDGTYTCSNGTCRDPNGDTATTSLSSTNLTAILGNGQQVQVPVPVWSVIFQIFQTDTATICSVSTQNEYQTQTDGYTNTQYTMATETDQYTNTTTQQAYATNTHMVSGIDVSVTDTTNFYTNTEYDSQTVTNTITTTMTNSYNQVITNTMTQTVVNNVTETDTITTDIYATFY